MPRRTLTYYILLLPVLTGGFLLNSDRGPLSRPSGLLSLSVATHDDLDHSLSLENSPETTSSWISTKDGGFLPNWKKLRPSPVVEEVKSWDDFQRVVKEEQDQLVCVRFYAPWCRACKRVSAAYKQLAWQYTNIKFVEVPLLEHNSRMLQGLGVPSFPYGHIYHPRMGLVEEQKMNRKVFGKFARIVQHYNEGFCPLEDEQLFSSGAADATDGDATLLP